MAIAAPLGSTTISGLAAVDVSASDNVGVTRVELRANGSTVATDTAAPYQFSWDTTKLTNGTATLVAYAYDAAGNSKASSSVAVNIANAVAADTTPPVVAIINPVNGSKVSGNVQVKVAASDNSGAAALKQSLYINGQLITSATGGSLSYTWNTRKASAGSYTIQATATGRRGQQEQHVGTSLAITSLLKSNKARRDGLCCFQEDHLCFATFQGSRTKQSQTDKRQGTRLRNLIGSTAATATGRAVRLVTASARCRQWQR